ncbi:MAG: hypothetical protein ACREIC_32435, partial [Limisphaerales bacterium]
MPDGQGDKHEPEIKHQNFLPPQKMAPRGIAVFQQILQGKEIALESQARVPVIARIVGCIGIPQLRVLEMDSFNNLSKIRMAEFLPQYFLAKCLNVKEKQRGGNNQYC